jgi:hypothetical protein
MSITSNLVRRWILAVIGAGVAYIVALILTLDLTAFINGGPTLVMSSTGAATLAGTVVGASVAPHRQWKTSIAIFVAAFSLIAVQLFISDSIEAGKIINFFQVVSTGIGAALAYAFARAFFVEGGPRG